METEKQEIINKVRILADLQNNNNPTNYATNRFAKIKCGDSVMFEFALLNGGKLVDTSQLQTLTLEIMDVGSLNAPLPRTVKLLATKTISKNDIVEIDNIEEFKNGKYNAQFLFTSTETIWGDGHKWISLSGYAQDGTKTTFTQGWIETFVSYCADEQIVTECELPYLRQDYADAVYLKSSSNLSDLPDITFARNNLDVYSKTETALLLSQVKSNKGELHFNGGTLACSNKWNLGTFSCVWTATLKSAELPTGSNNSWIYTCRHVANSTGFHVGVHQPVDNKPPYMWLQFYYYDSDNVSRYISKNFICSCYDNTPHVYSVVFNGTSVSFSVDNEKKIDATLEYGFTPTICSYPLTIAKITHKISRIKYFDFDITSANAPYTIDDYIDGKDEPLNSGLLSLADYTIRRNSTTNVVLDESGNGNVATISGNVYSPKDSAISAFVAEIKNQITTIQE